MRQRSSCSITSKTKKGEVTSPLRISEDLQIPYEIAHSLVLELVEEGKLQPLEEYDEGD